MVKLSLIMWRTRFGVGGGGWGVGVGVWVWGVGGPVESSSEDSATGQSVVVAARLLVALYIDCAVNTTGRERERERQRQRETET